MKDEISKIAQWIIDNRYPKSENNKISDSEMFYYLLDKIGNIHLEGIREGGDLVINKMKKIKIN